MSIKKYCLPIDTPIAPSPEELKLSNNPDKLMSDFEDRFYKYLSLQKVHFNRGLFLIKICSFFKSFANVYSLHTKTKHFSWCPYAEWRKYDMNYDPFSFLP